MSESQKIAELRSLLAKLDQPKQVAEALPLIPLGVAGARAAAPTIARGAASLAGKARNAYQNFQRGRAGERARTTAGTFTQAGGATRAGQAVTAAGQAVRNNPGTVGAIAGSAATAAALKAGDNAQVANKQTAPNQSDAETARLARQNAAAAAAPKPAANVANKPAAAAPVAPASTLTTDEEGELGVLAQTFDSMMGQDPELDKLLLQYQKLRPGAIDAGP